MDEKFLKLFQGFYLSLTILNYKIHTKKSLTGEFLQIKKTLERLIPVFNRLLEENNLTLEKVVDDQQIKNDDYPFVDITNKNIDVPIITTPTVTTTVINDDVMDDEEEDPEGDKMVDELTMKSLQQLDDILNSRWLYVEKEESDEDQGANDEEYLSEETLPEEESDFTTICL
jgi:hypothetical protein